MARIGDTVKPCKMLKKAMAVLAPHYSTLRFGVAAGNAAEAFYFHLGFMPGITQYSLVMQPGRPGEAQ